jgi:tetratricopeptide (TPR) repeat protein
VRFLRIFYLLLLVFLNPDGYSNLSAKTNPDSLQRVADDVKMTDTSRVEAMVWLALYYKDNDMPRAIQTGKNALDFATTTGNRYLIAKAQDVDGTILKFKGEYAAAESLYVSAAKTFEELKDTANTSLVYGHLGSYYQAVEQNQLAILYMLRSLKMDQERGEKARNSVAATLNNIGNVYYSDKNYSKALEFYKNALSINKVTGNRKYESINYLNIGNTLKDMKQIDSASWYYTESIRLAEELKVTWVVAASREGRGSCYLKQNKPEEAKQEFTLGLVAAKSFGNRELELYLESGMAQAYKDLGQLDSALYKWQYCMDTASLYYFSFLKSQLYLVGAEIFEQRGDLKRANTLYKTYAELKDSMAFEQNAIVYRNFEERLRQEDLQHEEELRQKTEQEQVEAENKRSKMALLFTGIVLLLSIGLGLFAFRSYRLKKKSHESISQQKDIIEEKNKEILSSIAYAQRLQLAILPSEKSWNVQFSESFIFYRPKDIVAGDFYWMETEGDHLLFAVADCTGHGVPGALVSVVCSNALNRCVHEFGLTRTGSILDKATDLVTETFENSGGDVYDGMDITLCALNRKTGELEWTGANLPLWIVRKENGVLEEIKPDKQPIGKFDLRKAFTSPPCTFRQAI